MRGSYLTTPVTVQNASAEKTRVWVACALAATRKQLADEKLERPGLFKEALLGEYRERPIYEKPPSLIVVELEHPHFLSKVAWVSHQLPQEVSTFEFEKTESGTLFYGKELPRPRRQGSTLVPVPMPPKEIKHAKFCRYAAWIRALAWWCEQLEWRLQPPEVGSVLKKEDEPSEPPAKTKQAVEAEQQARGSPQSSGAGAATWDTIEISFLSDERVQIRNGTDNKTRNYTEFGFVDSRNGKPNQAWVTLRDLAEGNGMILFAARKPTVWRKVEKRIQEIRKALRDHFGITSDPFLFKEGVGYEARFKIGTSPSFHT